MVVVLRVVVRAFRAEMPEEAPAAVRYWGERLVLPDQERKISDVSLVTRGDDGSRFVLEGTLSIAGDPANAAFRLACWRERACIFALRCDVVVEEFEINLDQGSELPFRQ